MDFLVDFLMDFLMNLVMDFLMDCLTEFLMDFLMDFLVDFLVDFFDRFPHGLVDGLPHRLPYGFPCGRFYLFAGVCGPAVRPQFWTATPAVRSYWPPQLLACVPELLLSHLQHVLVLSGMSPSSFLR